MLKTMSVTLLAASILAAPAFAAGPAKTDSSAKSIQTTGTAKTDTVKSGASKSDAAKTEGGAQVGDKTNEMKPTVGKSKSKPHASLLRHTHRHVAHLRHHHNVKASHAAVRTPALTKVSFNATGHKKVSVKRVTPATRRG